MRSGQLALIVLLAIVPLASAQADGISQLTVESLEADFLQAALVGFEFYNNAQDDSQPDYTFQLDAASLLVVAVEAEAYVRGSTWVASPPAESTANHNHAVLFGMAARPTHRMSVLPLPGEAPPTVAAACAQLAVPQQPAVEAEPYVDPNAKTYRQETSTAIQSQPCSNEALRIHGTFLVTLWEHDATITNVTMASTILRSGVEPANVPDPAASTLYPAAGRARQLYLYATDADLTIPNPAMRTHRLFLHQVHATGDSLVLHKANGQVRLGDNDEAVNVAQLDLRGDLDAAISRQGQRLAVSVLGVNGASADGAVMFVATTPPPFGGFNRWLFTLPVGLLAVGLIALLLRHRALVSAYHRYAELRGGSVLTPPETMREARGAGLWALSYRAMKRGRAMRAYTLNARSRRVFPRSLDAAWLRGALLERDGEQAQAIAEYAKLYPLLGHARDRASLACHIAEAAVTLHETEQRNTMATGKRLDEAISWLQKAAEQHLATFELCARRSCFDVLLNNPWFEGARNGGVRHDQARRRDLGLPV